MDRVTFAKEASLNREAYDQIRARIRRDYAGKYITFAHGKMVGAANTFDDARNLLSKLEGLPEYYLIFPADEEPDFDLIYDLVGSI